MRAQAVLCESAKGRKDGELDNVLMSVGMLVPVQSESKRKSTIPVPAAPSGPWPVAGKGPWGRRWPIGSGGGRGTARGRDEIKGRHRRRAAEVPVRRRMAEAVHATTHGSIAARKNWTEDLHASGTLHLVPAGGVSSGVHRLP